MSQHAAECLLSGLLHLTCLLLTQSGHRKGPLWASGSRSVEVDRFGKALKIAFAALGKMNIRASDQILHGSGHETLSRLG